MSPVSVLLVDDSETQRAMIARSLEKGGFKVTTAVNGLDCLSVLGELRPDIVLLDVVMPGIDGWETLDRIRQTNGVPVIMLTARAEEIDRVRGLRAGADDYIGKPFQQDELEARIEAVMRRADLGRRDALTGLSNRRTFDEHLDSMLAQERKTGQAFALVIFDIDHFKAINDTQGHPEGDRVLQDVARIAARQLRAGEQIFRIGGEEFGIVIPGDGKTGVRVAERVRAAVQDEPREPRLPTLSAGVASFPHDATTREALFQAADLALYAAKQGGRNAVSLAA
jgi:two-component system cell cycle response regulator